MYTNGHAFVLWHYKNRVHVRRAPMAESQSIPAQSSFIMERIPVGRGVWSISKYDIFDEISLVGVGMYVDDLLGSFVVLSNLKV